MNNSTSNDSRPSTAPAPLASLHADILAKLGWSHTATLTLPGRAATFATPAELPPLAPPSTSLLASVGPLYCHQATALRHHLNGHNVVLATGTGSGKTRVFHFAATELLAREPSALILALYPGKALALEQAEKWTTALAAAGLSSPHAVALITGDQRDKAARISALRRASVALFTPDVLHAWLLGNLAQAPLRTVLARTRLVALDEAHTCSGVFGSNVLWMLRRLQAVLAHLGTPAPRWLAASGTLASPSSHLEQLTGQPFHALTEADDAAPRHPRRLHFITPGDGTPLTAGLGDWLKACASSPHAPPFIAFTQSRLQTEIFALIANRDPHSDPEVDLAPAATVRIAPYRAGLSPTERADLQSRFARHDLRGLTCTSAFELGVDLPGLDLGFLVGLPESPASFWQRIGRFGRHSPADIFVLDDSSPHTLAAFANPASLLTWRARDAALYPDNPVLIARHVLCHDHERRALNLPDDQLPPHTFFRTPNSAFLESHASYLRGEFTPHLREALRQQGQTQPPHIAFPLRTIEETYTFRPSHHGAFAPDGFVTYSQILREAYPGAVYYHNGRPWRILHLNSRHRTLTVAPERHYHTKPQAIPPTFLPDLSQPAFADLRWPHSELRLIETHGRAVESITGFSEVRGNLPASATQYNTGAFGTSGPLYHSYETTGILLTAPVLQDDLIERERLAHALRLALLQECPRETPEIAAATGRLRADRRDLTAGTRFLALYDTVPGSLRLSAVLSDPHVLFRTLQRAAQQLDAYAATTTDPRAQATAQAIHALLPHHPHATPHQLPLDWPDTANHQLAFAPGSIALHRQRNLPVTIERALTDLDGNLHYLVRRVDDPAFHGQVPASALIEIPDRSQIIPLSEALLATAQTTTP